MSRTITENLAKRKVDTHVLMQKSDYEPQPSYTLQNAVHIHAFKRHPIISHLGLTPNPRQLARHVDADIYHAEAMNIWAYHVQKSMPQAKHVLTCQDPQIGEVWKNWKRSPIYFMKMKRRGMRTRFSQVLRNLAYNWMERQSLLNADLVCSQTKYHISLVQKEFGLSYAPLHLPNPIEVPNHKIRKNLKPTVLFMARFDPVKRPWIFIKIAKRLPHMQFVMAGKSHDPNYERQIRRIAEKMQNLTVLGYVVEEEKKKAFEDSWVMVNCSLKEALPVSFLESCAHKCAIVSCQNPDGFASNFGVYVKNGENIDEYVSALKTLLNNESQLSKIQQLGYDYVRETHEVGKVIDKHLEIYKRLLA